MTAPLWHPAPIASPSSGDAQVRILEVGPRDGLQAEAEIVPSEVKAEFCRRLVAAGSRRLEAVSFVSPRWVPQLADAEQVLGGLEIEPSVTVSALTLNLRGLERAQAAGITDVAVVVSATESFARANLNASLDEAIATAAEVTAAAVAAGVRVRGYLSMAFGDPWEGAVAPAHVGRIAATLRAAGCSTVALGDTIGVGTPGAVEEVLRAVTGEGVPVGELAMHFHDTYGQALANVVASLEAGVREFDSSAGGLGRCPYAPGATGNLATEELVWMLEGMGVSTGIDLDALAATTWWMAGQMGREVSPSRVATALRSHL